jgi:Zn-dependent peptidase ImmA (M78 family)
MNPTDPVAALCAYHGQSDPEQLVLRLCQDLIDECVTQAGPTPLNILASCQGVRAIHRKAIRPEIGCSGFLAPVDGGYEITVNAGEPLERQNFSIAHEIVHTFFRNACPCSQPTEREEHLCNLGAAELTMPASRFSAYLAQSHLSLASVDACKTEFAVSFEAAARRAMSVTSEPACVFIAALGRTIKEENLDTGRPILRVIRWRASPSWPYPYGYKNRPVEPASLIGQAFANQDERHGRTRLGLPFDPATYQLEARGYGYSRLGNPDYRQAVSLARFPANGTAA